MNLIVMNSKTEKEETIKISFLSFTKASLGWPVKIGERTYLGWSGYLPFYLFFCRHHGWQINYPAGWDKDLICSECYHEFLKSIGKLEDHLKGKGVES